MTPSEAERQILLMHMGTENSPKDNPDLMDMSDIITRLKRRYDAGEAYRTFPRKSAVTEGDDEADVRDADAGEQDDEDQNIIFIADMRVTETHAIMLLSYGDADGAAPAFLNRQTRRSRTVLPSPNEVNGSSAHMVIDLEAQQAQGFRGLYRCTLERMPHLGRTAVINFLNRMLRLDRKHHNDLFFPDPETRKQRTFYPRLTADLHLSPALLDDLRTGTLSHIELTTRQNLDQVDEDIAVEVQKRTLRIKPSFLTQSPEGIRDRLNQLARWADRNNYEEMQVHVKGATSRPGASPRFATTLDDAAEALYSRIEVLDGFEGLLQCYETIHDPLQNGLVQIIGNNDLWPRE